MKKIKRGQVGALAAACTILSVAACSSVATSSGSSTATGGSTAGSTASGTSTSSITIAGVYGNSTDPFWATLACGAQQEATTLGVKYQAFSSTTLDTSAFSQNFSSAQLIKPNGIFVNPANPNQFITQYKSLMSQGVPVVTINSSTPPNQYKVVGTGTSDASTMLTQVASLVTASSGSMLVVNGIPGLVPVEVRLNPVVKAIQTAHPGLTSLPTIYSGFDVNKATQQVSSDLIANPNLKVIVAADGPDGQAAAAAVEAAHKAGSVTVIALDATPAEVAALKAGTITALVAQSPQQIGADQVKELVSYVKAHPNGGAVPVNVGTISVPQALLTKSNVDSPSNSAYVYKASC
jgi:ribose transport system substrate-binding protein